MLGVTASVAAAAAAAALRAVDGVALKFVVDRWAQASGEARALAFEAAFAVRQVEIGFASLLSLIFGLIVSVFDVALLLSPRVVEWVARAREWGLWRLAPELRRLEGAPPSVP